MTTAANLLATTLGALAVAFALVPRSGQAAPVTPDFAKDVRPFLAQHCGKCHGEKKQAGKLALHQLDGSLTAEKARETWARVAEKLWLGEMPPEDEPQPARHRARGELARRRVRPRRL